MKQELKDITDNLRWTIIPLLILISMLVCIGLRVQPYSLSITDTWASDTISNNVRAQISNNIESQYPQLPQDKKNSEIEKQWDEYLSTNSDMLFTETQKLSNYYKSRLQDPTGQTYLLAIDPYLWYGNSKNYINNGQFGDYYDETGEDMYSLRNGRLGRKAAMPFNSIITVGVYKLVSPFNDNFTILKAAFIIPLLIIALSIIPIFFIGRKIGGNTGGFVASLIFAFHPALLSRTIAGFSDTDPYTVFFPLLATWFFFEAVEKRTYIWMILCGFSLAFFTLAWGQGWWYTFDFIIITLGITFVILSLIRKGYLKENLKFSKQSNIILGSIMVLSFLITRTLLGLWAGEKLTVGLKFIWQAIFVQPTWFMGLKSVGLTTIWPNVLTTVAELNPSSFNSILASLNPFLFWIGVVGLVLLLISGIKNETYLTYSVYLIIWLGASIYASLTSLRFMEIMVPVFALSIAASIGMLFKRLDNFTDDKKYLITGKVFFIVIILVLLQVPFLGALDTTNKIPSYTDAWDESLKEIKYNSTDAIITSWWDFGHWFVAMSERRVTFDGGDQGNRIHWVGKSLLTDNEQESVGILRMLNCGQELAYDTLENYTNDSYYSKLLLDDIILLDRHGAEEKLANEGFDADQRLIILGYTHCGGTIDQYYITSGDMVGKAGVWAHFGSWNFQRALMYNTVKSMEVTQGIEFIQTQGYSSKDAETMYYEIQNTGGDNWIAGWPTYKSDYTSCNLVDNTTVYCGNGLVVNLDDYSSTYVTTQEGNKNLVSLVYIENETFKEKVFQAQIPYSAALIKQGVQYYSVIMDPLLSKSMFTRLYYFDGIGLEHYEMFSDKKTFQGLKIKVWKVDLDELDE